jgi:probable HAF family extracellular repeat protein
MRKIPYAILIATLAGGGAVTQASLAASGGPGYSVYNLPSAGGTVSSGNSIDNLGIISGDSNQPGDQTTHATVWLFGSRFDLGTLGGANSDVQWPVKNNVGVISGIAETAEVNKLGEAWSCSAFFPGNATLHNCLGFVSEWGQLRALPTLGGYNGFATGTNDFGQTVGWAENTVHDTTCNPPQVLQFRAVIWGPGKDQIDELPPLPGSDTVSAATAINDAGQVVGISGICSNAVGGFSAIHAVIWQNGKPADMGNIGGAAWNTPMAINRNGVVVGFANVQPGGALLAHAFIWTRSGGMRDLGTLSGQGADAQSQALGINDQGQVVGLSCTAGFASCQAFLWQNDVMTNLISLVAPGYDDQLIQASDINDAGVITGEAADSSGDVLSFVATPGALGNSHAVAGGGSSTQNIPLPAKLRAKLLQRMGLKTSE